jgi:hypothetical protein
MMVFYARKHSQNIRSFISNGASTRKFTDSKSLQSVNFVKVKLLL